MDDSESTKTNSFNQQFCDRLEYHLTKAFSDFEDSRLMGIWCDGILVPDSLQLIKEKLVKTRQVTTKAFIGKDGQAEFSITIKLGPNSLASIINNQELGSCLPDTESSDWWVMDFQAKTISIQLL